MFRIQYQYKILEKLGSKWFEDCSSTYMLSCMAESYDYTFKKSGANLVLMVQTTSPKYPKQKSFLNHFHPHVILLYRHTPCCYQRFSNIVVQHNSLP